MRKHEENNKSRTENFVKNTTIGIVMQILSLILSFVSRTIFIKMLTEEYLGINGLFSNILSTLSFVELGFGTAVIYMMYKPVAENNKERIKTLINYYKKLYFVIGTIILLLGISVIPFMKYIIKDAPQINENLNIIYVLFLINTSIGYFYSHKTAIINANQKNYILSVYNQIFKWIQLILQILILLISKNYIFYLLIQIACTFLNNILISMRANKMFPYIKEKNVAKVSKEDKKSLNAKVKSLIFYKLNPAILNGSDNLILSSIIGIKSVGIYSNYYLITSYLLLFIGQITMSLESSIGNLNALSTKEKKEDIFYKVLFLVSFIYGIIVVILMGILNNFIEIWIGTNYLFTNFVLLSILLYFYINGVSFACYAFRTTTGLFEKTKFVPLFEVIINITASIILAKYIGIAGVFLGTSVAKLSTFFWTDPKVLYKYVFCEENKKKYYLKYFRYFITTILIGIIVYEISILFVATNYFMLIIKTAVISLITIILFTLSVFKTGEFKFAIKLMKDIFLSRIVGRLRKNEKDS